MDALDHLRQLIRSLDEALTDALSARARLGFDPSFYAMPTGPLPELDAIAGEFADAPALAARVGILRPAYLLRFLPELCTDAPVNGPAPCLASDAACLDALARRLALSVHVATRKRETLPDSLQSALQTRDPRRVEAAITHPAVEENVLARIHTRIRGQSSDPTLPNRIGSLYAQWIIPLSRKIQVHGLLTTHP